MVCKSLCQFFLSFLNFDVMSAYFKDLGKTELDKELLKLRNMTHVITYQIFMLFDNFSWYISSWNSFFRL